MSLQVLAGEWWVWIGFAILLGGLEIVVPGYIFLGFAVGAGIVGGLIALGGGIGSALASSLAVALLTFAILSLVSWIVLRRALGIRKGQVKHIHHDINED